MVYRREIDGLRALAVIPVIFFHAGFQTFSGGFVGVDVFFVISGYLITSIILAEKQAGAFSLASFYERRARRILPALFLVMFSCLPFAWLWLMPNDLINFSQSLIAVSTFSSNFFFWRESGYFDTEGGLKPLLHTWSLAVEEQYYLLFPVFLILAWRLGKQWIFAILVLAAIISLAVAQWGSLHMPYATFFLLPTRGWELLIGALAAFYFFTKDSTNKISKNRPLVDESFSVLGLLLIAYAVCDYNRQTPFPGLYALAPTVGAVFIILFATQQTMVGRFLGSNLLVGVGLISYSAYLWHQPLFAFARFRSVGEPSKALFVTLVAVALLLAYLSWKFVEVPFRNRQYVKSKQIFLYSVFLSSFFVAIGLVCNFNDGFIDRLSKDQQTIYAFSKYDFSSAIRNRVCTLGGDQTYTDFSKECGATVRDKPITLVWGDSFAAAASIGLRELAPNVVQYTAHSCPPIINTNFEVYPNCIAINSFVLGEIERLHPDDVVLVAYWAAAQYQKQEPVKRIATTIEYIKRVSPSTHITLVGNVPMWPPTLPILMLRVGLNLDGEKSLPNPDYDELESLDSALSFVAANNGIFFVSALDSLCEGRLCRVVAKTNHGYELTALDVGHLTEAGSLLLAEKILLKMKSERNK